MDGSGWLMMDRGGVFYSSVVHCLVAAHRGGSARGIYLILVTRAFLSVIVVLSSTHRRG